MSHCILGLNTAFQNMYTAWLTNRSTKKYKFNSKFVINLKKIFIYFEHKNNYKIICFIPFRVKQYDFYNNNNEGRNTS